MSIQDWTLAFEDFTLNPKEVGLRETLCTLGNGYFATRGAGSETQADDLHYPGTYLAGGYNRLSTGFEDRIIESEDLVNFPNWLPITFRIDHGDWLDLRRVAVLEYEQALDLRRGLLTRNVRFRDHSGRLTKLGERRFVHMRYQHLGAIELTIVPENWSGRIEVRSAIDGRVVNAGVPRYERLANQHFHQVEAASDTECMWLRVTTSQSALELVEAVRTRANLDGIVISSGWSSITEGSYVARKLVCELRPNQQLVIEKLVAIYTSRDRAISEPGLEAVAAVKRAGSFDDLVRDQADAWKHLWRQFDLKVEGNDVAQELMRFNIFHLLQTASPNIMKHDVGVPARGWHGEAYRGHVFWDELFILPFLNFRKPEIVRSLLLYRYRRLDEARQAARHAGYRGAMFPWQSGSNGREEAQRIHLNPVSGRWNPDHTHLQRHVGAAIAYNVWQYCKVTGDKEFLHTQGAEMIFEIARFWASIATLNKSLGRYEILGVVGPDEYHDRNLLNSKPGVNNNTYTNVMAVWVLCRAIELLDLLPEVQLQELRDHLQLDDTEIKLWEDVSRKMLLPVDEEGFIEQFEGYSELQELDWEKYRHTYSDIRRLDRILESEEDTTNRYKVSKQADVLMLFYLFSHDELSALFGRLGYAFGEAASEKNLQYYLERTSHGSSLSPLVHAWILADLDPERSWHLFKETLEYDRKGGYGTTREGVHLAAMVGAADLMQRKYTGMEVRENVLWFNPRLPHQVESLSFNLSFHQGSISVDVSRLQLSVLLRAGAPNAVRVGFAGIVHQIRPGETALLTN